MINAAVKNILDEWIAELRKVDSAFLIEEGMDLIVLEEINNANDHLIQVCVKMTRIAGDGGPLDPYPVYWVKMHKDAISVGSLLVYEDTERVSFNDPMLIPKLKGLLNASLHQTLELVEQSDHVEFEMIQPTPSPQPLQETDDTFV